MHAAAAPFKSLVVLWLAAWASCAALAQPAPATPFPTKTVRVTVHNSPGSAPDVLARYLSQRLSEQWKHAVVVDNRGAAGGIVAADALAKAPADGHTLLVGGDGPITILPNLQSNLPYNAQRDLVPVVSLGHVDFVLVAHPKTGFRSLGDFVRAAKAQPGRYSYASAGNGSALQFSMEMLKQQAGFFATHIPYRGGPMGLQDVIAGQVEVMFIALGPALPHIRSGRLTPLGTTGDKRNALLPDVPAIAETYAGYGSGTWFGLFAPANTPQPVLDTIAADVGRIVQTPAARAELAAQGIDATGYPQQQFQRQVTAEYVRYGQIVKTAGIKIE
ncbi:ABC transporter substrate-binding protein [Acidovorax sp. Leaf76]|uniref:Bug family tripartite tricarboxylate transporter substrate binding protein n=1 Tax=unclassified Acidovorax TaxID=2684926 RepID=UPI0006FA512D|nr:MULTISPECIES: tripartite tricarboxylate transporter substrate-binding protein [unclassified Acidovorax]KQO16190.1 ABC transporter substrate-binding protein [Acidovorax sp. Leaf76]KQO32262.1 ABC transporter substrate-binding protein [Acidovorax sp. Leaf84]KQS31823.1 ABC transporter substrate-binding protein [Acidovorax sp. Leaf191]